MEAILFTLGVATVVSFFVVLALHFLPTILARRTPLHYAAFEGRHKLAALLLDRGADPNARDEDGWPPLQFAARSGHVEVARSLLDAGSDVNARDEGGETPLHFAAKGGRLNAIHLLLDRGADPNAGYPLHMAAARGHDEVVRLLLDHGAGPNAHEGTIRTNGSPCTLPRVMDASRSPPCSSTGAPTPTRETMSDGPPWRSPH